MHNQEAQFSLHQIILLNVYGKGDIIHLKLDGHASLTGKNGVGKTSLLRLIPVFYGESPNKLTHNGGGAILSFTNYYLPHTNSFIVYEYYRKGKACMAVLHASNTGDSVYYRFIDQPYALERFVDEQGELIDGNDLYRHISKRGEYCSTQITSVKSYRSIIQNTASDKNDRSIAQNFSFVEAGARLTHIEKIVTGMFSKTTRFSDIRKIIASCVEEDAVVKLETNKSALDYWINDYSAYRKVMEYASDMQIINSISISHQENLHQLIILRDDFLRLQEHQKVEICKISENIQKIREDLEESEQKNNQELQNISSQIGEVNGQIKDTQDFLDKLEKTKLYYEKQEIKSWSDGVDDLTQMRANLELKKHNREIIIGDFDKISKRFEDLIQKIKNDFYHDSMSIQKEIQSVRDETDQLKERLRKEFDILRKNLKDESDKREALIFEKKESLLKKNMELNFSVQHPQCPDEFIQSKENAQQKFHSAVEHEKASQIALDVANTNHHEATKKWQSLDQQIENALSQKKHEEENISRLLSLKNAKSGTLLHFLRTHKPEWTKDIAKVISQDLLLREDLTPTVIEDQTLLTLSLFGVSLDLSVIESPLVADEIFLQKQIDFARQRMDVHQKEIDTKTVARDQQKNIVEKSLNKVKEMEIALTKNKGMVKSSQEILKISERNYLSELDKVRQQNQDALRIAQKEMEMHETSIREFRSNRIEREKQQEHDLHQQLETIQKEMQEKISVLERNTERSKIIMEQSVNELENQREEALKSHKVDTDSLKQMENDIKAIEISIQKIQSHAKEVMEWRHWLHSDWEYRHEKAKKLHEAQSNLDELMRQRSVIIQNHRNQCETLKKNIESKQKERGNIEKEQNFILSRLTILKAYDIEIESQSFLKEIRKSEDLIRPFSVLEMEMNRLKKDLDSENEQIQKILPPILSAFSSIANTVPCRFYESRKNAIGSTSCPSVLPYWKWANTLRDWFDTEHESARRILLTQCRNISGNIDAYHAKIKSLKKKVSQFATNLQENIASLSRFNSIHKIDVHISTTLDALDGWNDIQQMSALFGLWQTNEEQDLPSDEFVDAVRHVSEWLKGKTNTEVKLEDLLDLSVDIEEIGQPKKTVKNEDELINVSSTGLSYLILCVILVGLINKIRAGQSVQILWALDELSSLDKENTYALLQMLSDHHIHLVSAFPSADPEILGMIHHNYQVRTDRRLAQFKKETAHV